ncbi:MAG TPA: histidine phosphatase family protein [Patescibacteria group bacterium]|nr:histidine phosphatase family protein [Patescibacteria group bacterium]
MNNLTTIYLVRHGESKKNAAFHANDETYKSNDPLGSYLSDTGITQAKTRAKTLKNVHFDAAFSSDLNRARQTAEIIALEHDLEVKTTEVIRERVYGKTWENNSVEVRKKFQDEMQAKLEKLDKVAALQYKHFPDMESGEEVVSRLITFLREIAVAYEGKTLLVVAHGNLMRMFLIHIGFGNMQELRTGTITNTGYVKLESDGVDFFVRETSGITKKL